MVDRTLLGLLNMKILLYSLVSSFLFWVCNNVRMIEMEMMKERFAKLLLGEDMSGGGKGVCTALAISNAITNLSGQRFPLVFYSLRIPQYLNVNFTVQHHFMLVYSISIKVG